ncbi:hypothetical protein BV22DRAFT_1024426 [Leucogyrophana mollusca]|uniref:Uncharacterized protein n=1 Tax=Leucogyrophana mollusca TaxID=85980 RepID=A0ACB8AYC6_9AGAM|nr:hypothetical protein BV22DRAFT_1024426 [Leucogyrophana mollusca]
MPFPSDLESWEIFPNTIEGMVEWADLFRDSTVKDSSRNRILIYKSLKDSTTGDVFPVSIRLQGILKHFKLERFGSWTGRQLRTPSVTKFSRNLYFQRKVFTKVNYLTIMVRSPGLTGLMQRAEGDYDDVGKIPFADDPHGWYRAVQPHWQVADPVTIGRVAEDGVITPLNPLLLSRGDFVEIGAEFDIVVSRDQDHRPVTKTFLAFHHVVQLATTAELHCNTNEMVCSFSQVYSLLFEQIYTTVGSMCATQALSG